MSNNNGTSNNSTGPVLLSSKGNEKETVGVVVGLIMGLGALMGLFIFLYHWRNARAAKRALSSQEAVISRPRPKVGEEDNIASHFEDPDIDPENGDTLSPRALGIGLTVTGVKPQGRTSIAAIKIEPPKDEEKLDALYPNPDVDETGLLTERALGIGVDARPQGRISIAALVVAEAASTQAEVVSGDVIPSATDTRVRSSGRSTLFSFGNLRRGLPGEAAAEDVIPAPLARGSARLSSISTPPSSPSRRHSISGTATTQRQQQPKSVFAAMQKGNKKPPLTQLDSDL